MRLYQKITCYLQAQFERLTDKKRNIGEYLCQEELELSLSSEIENSYMIRLQSILSKRIDQWRESYVGEVDKLDWLEIQLNQCLELKRFSTWLGQKENNEKQRNKFDERTLLGEYDGIIASHFSAEQAKQAKQAGTS